MKRYTLGTLAALAVSIGLGQGLCHAQNLTPEAKKSQILARRNNGRGAAEFGSATNGILTVKYSSSGQFTILTGANYPNFPGKDVFFPIGTSNITLRDVNARIMWTNDGVSSAGLTGYTADDMVNEHTVTTEIPNGFRTVYTIPNFQVTEDVVIKGTVLSDTSVLHQVSVKNTSTAARQFGVRYMWDWKIADSDDSLFRPRLPNGTFSDVFKTYQGDALNFRLYEEVDSIDTKTFSVFGSIQKLGLDPIPTPPDQFRYASWSRAVSTAWDFTNTGSGTDSATVYYWGFTNPITVGAGQSQPFAQYVTTQLTAIAKPTFKFSAPSYRVDEGAGKALITIERGGDPSAAASVQFKTRDKTAKEPGDYSRISTILNFAPEEISKTIEIPIVDDTVLENNETVDLLLVNPQNATILAPNPAELTITDNERSITISDVALKEGKTDQLKTFAFNVKLSQAGGSPILVNAITANETATAGLDYTALDTTTLTFAPGETSKKVEVTVTGDTIVEDNETFLVNLSDPVGAKLADNQAVGTILNDDLPPQPVSGNILKFRPAPDNPMTVEKRPFVNVFVTLDNQRVATNSEGNFVFPLVNTGSYVVAPEAIDATDQFGPTSRTIEVADGPVSGVNFRSYLVLGRVTKINSLGQSVGMAGVSVMANNSIRATTDADGYYCINKLGIGTFSILPILDGYDFTVKAVTLPTSGIADVSPCGKANFVGTKSGTGSSAKGN